MGWNSYDCFGVSVNETQVKAAADYMAANLKSFGYQYVVVDIRWYDPNAVGFFLGANANVVLDVNGRLQPANNRFPSANGGLGFKPLADYIHNKGLKFGIHMMRGIPQHAYNFNTQILGTPYHAQDIADTASTCRWNDDMYGVDVTRPGGQEYYNSVADQWAAWGVDFVKLDDLSADPGVVNPTPYHSAEIEAIRKAIDRTGRPIVLSTSPGPTPLGQGRHIMSQANMWRIDDDFWDSWPALLRQFPLLRDWTPFRRPGHFPDADMLPLGKIGAGSDPNGGRTTNFTADEQQTLMTLWAIARSPLMYGGILTQMDPATLALITNSEMLAVNQNSAGNRELFNQNGLYAWIADVPNSTDKYLALFNTRDPVAGQNGTTISVLLTDIGFSSKCDVRNLWQHSVTHSVQTQFSPVINWHGAGLYRVSGSQYNAKPPATVVSQRGNRQIELIWDPSNGALSYNVYRSLTSGGPYSLIATNISETDYVDQGLTNGTRYYYVVSATTDVGTSATSTEVSDVPLGSLSGSWETLDIGYPGHAGAAGAEDELYRLEAGGVDIWGTADDFRYAWLRTNGDQTLIARVRSLDYTDQWAKAGVMLREDGTPGARHAFMLFAAGGQTGLQYRSSPNTTPILNSLNATAPRWLKLIRKANTFYGYHSSDGANWISAGQTSFAMSNATLAGLAVTAHNDGALTTATFDFVSVLPNTSSTFTVLRFGRSGLDALVVTRSLAGKTYQLQKAASLTSVWQNVGSPQIGTSDLLTFPDSGGAGSPAFYRVIETAAGSRAAANPIATRATPR